VITAKRLSIYGMLVMYASRKPLLHCARSCNQSTLVQRVPELLCRIVGVISKYYGNCHKTLQYRLLRTVQCTLDGYHLYQSTCDAASTKAPSSK